MNTKAENYTENSETTVDEFFKLLVSCRDDENEIDMTGIVSQFEQLGLLLRPLKPKEETTVSELFKLLFCTMKGFAAITFLLSIVALLVGVVTFVRANTLVGVLLLSTGLLGIVLSCIVRELVDIRGWLHMLYLTTPPEDRGRETVPVPVSRRMPSRASLW